MGLPAGKRRYTIQEYLELEEKALDRHEFHDGDILAMSGGSYEHSRIASNLILAIGKRLHKPCHPLGSDMRVRIPGRPYYIYPDISILCSEPKFDADDLKRTTILNPLVVIEVLSEATEGYDRGEKFQLYQRVESLVEYIVVAQKRPLIESFARDEQGTWKYTSIDKLDVSAGIVTMNLPLPMVEVYEGISL